jgi:large subunit ribosomal protein L20
MTRVKHAKSSLGRKKRMFKAVKGQRGTRSTLLKTAKEALRKSLIASYIGRKKKKRDFRSLWIARITAACRAEGISYSRFIAGLKKANVSLNRKILAFLAAKDEKAFKVLVKKAKA